MAPEITLQTCLQKLQYVGVLNFATVDAGGSPQIRCISAIHYGADGLYFLTAQGKEFYKQLLADGRVQVLGYTRYKEMLRLSGRAVPVPEAEQVQWVDTIFAEQPYLANVYPGQTRQILRVFYIGAFEIEYFNLGVRPICRHNFRFGGYTQPPKGYQITDACIGCGTCAKNCPQQAIQPGKPYAILQQHCLHCGSCAAHCPVQAIRPRTAADDLD